MQHHPGSWYIPWGVPLQKMMMPFNPANSQMNSQMNPFNPAGASAGYPQIAAAAVQSPQQTQQSYQHHQMHQLHHNSAAAAVLQHQQLHPAAAAMFRNFVGHPHGQQQILAMGQQQIPGQPQQPQQQITNQTQSQLTQLNLNSVGVLPVRQNTPTNTGLIMPMRKVCALYWKWVISNIFYYFLFIEHFDRKLVGNSGKKWWGKKLNICAKKKFSLNIFSTTFVFINTKLQFVSSILQ